MVNHQPDLQGWADRDEDPQWMENAIERVRARGRTNKQDRRRTNGTYVFYDDPFRVFLDEAAKRRGMAMSAYIRRATAAFLAHDLGVPFTEIVKHTAKPQTDGGKSNNVGARIRTHDDGRGMGPWLIEGLRELR
jgi:hypothetical protein